MTFPNVADISSAQGSFDAAAYAASGRLAIIIKVTEFLHYVNPFYVQWRDQAHQHGLVTGEYHYMGDSQHDILGSPVDEAHHCLSVVGDHTPGRFLVCDIESATKIGSRYLYGMSAQQAADWGAKFLETCTNEGGWPDMAYSMSGSGVLQRLKPPYPRWYAAYPGPVPADRALHQFSSSSPVPGVGHCDDSYCFIDLKAFSQGSSTPQNPEEDDMVEVFEHKGGLYVGVVGLYYNWIPTPGVFYYLCDPKRPGRPIPMHNRDGSATIQDDVFNMMKDLGTFVMK